MKAESLYNTCNFEHALIYYHRGQVLHLGPGAWGPGGLGAWGLGAWGLGAWGLGAWGLGAWGLGPVL